MNDLRHLSLIERAFQLAQSGTVDAVDEIRKTLQREGYSRIQESTSGRATQTQLRTMIAKARTPIV
jgi:hypothetical protein